MSCKKIDRSKPTLHRFDDFAENSVLEASHYYQCNSKVGASSSGSVFRRRFFRFQLSQFFAVMLDAIFMSFVYCLIS